MILSLPPKELQTYVERQLLHFFPDHYAFSGNDVDAAFSLALERTEYCFRHITHRGYSVKKADGWEAEFSHLHSDQYSQFLYFLSNSLWNISQNLPLCSKLVSLNKALNGLFCSFKGELPQIFLFGHPIGSVIGNADYSDFLVIFQNVTINTNEDENGFAAPKLGKGLFLAAGAKIIGNKPIGDRVSLGVNVLVHEQEIPGDSVVICREGKTVIAPRKKEICMAQQYFNIPIQ